MWKISPDALHILIFPFLSKKIWHCVALMVPTTLLLLYKTSGWKGNPWLVTVPTKDPFFVGGKEEGGWIINQSSKNLLYFVRLSTYGHTVAKHQFGYKKIHFGEDWRPPYQWDVVDFNCLRSENQNFYNLLWAWQKIDFFSTVCNIFLSRSSFYYSMLV